MEFSHHALVRFVQRVVGIVNEEAAEKYLKNNKYEVNYKLLRFVNESKMLYDRLTYRDSSEVFKYLINGDILVVIASNSNKVVTLYDIKIDLDDVNNHEKLMEFTKVIRRNADKLVRKDSEKKKSELESRKLEAIIARKEQELEDLRAELADSVLVSRGIVSEIRDLKRENKDLMEQIMFGFKKYF